MQSKNKYNQGQSLVELILAFFVMALVIVAIVGITTISLRNANSAKNNTLARRYAEEGMEHLRQLRDEDWISFRNKAPLVPNGASYCLNNLSNNLDISGGCSQAMTGLIFEREANMTRLNDNIVLAVVVVTWSDENGLSSVTISGRYYNWQ